MLIVRDAFFGAFSLLCVAPFHKHFMYSKENQTNCTTVYIVQIHESQYGNS